LPLIGGGGGTILRAFCLSSLWQIYETLYLLLRVEECRFTTPSLGARMQASNSSGCRNDMALHGGWASSSALGLQTQHSFDSVHGIVNKHLLIIANIINPVNIFIYSGPPEKY
jgi:hypothetical protein